MSFPNALIGNMVFLTGKQAGHEKESLVLKILIAEDSLMSRNLLKAMLAKSGHEVLVAVNGAEAWEIMQRPDAPRLAILDWIMPIMEGIEVCRQIRSLKTDRPPYIIMLTTMAEKSDIVAGLEAGADDYLIKPCDIGELRARIGVGRRVSEMQDIVAGKIEELNNALDRIMALQGNPPITVEHYESNSDGLD